MTRPMQLVPPSLDRLPSYVAALKRGWSPDNIKGAAGSIEELAHIEKDPRSFVESLTDREAKGPPIVLPDGSSATRLPGFRLWLWDTEFCGSIGLRWQPDTSELPPHVLGHIGYAVVPWKEGRGYAKLALKLMLEHARAQGWNTSKSRRTQTMLLPAESLKLTAVSSLTGSRGLRNMAALMLFAIESHSSSQRPCPNQSMKPTAPRQNKFSVFATTPCRGSSLLVRRMLPAP